jgi:protein-S-isoprenylcysteine O-methyltransferase Ste14
MAVSVPASLAKWLYGALFVVLLPLLLVGWAYGASANVRLPAVKLPALGAVVAAGGALLWLSGTVALRVKGGGLPMNAFPPPRLVSTGVFAWVAHPLYVGATLASAGAALLVGSASGLWLVVPMLALAAAALWWGYERIDLRARVGAPERAARLGAPFASPATPRMAERVGALVVALAAPLLAAGALHGAGLAGRAWSVGLGSAFTWGAVGVFVAGAVAAPSLTTLRDAVLTSWVASVALALLVLALPAGPFGGRLPLAPAGAALAIVAMIGAATLTHGTRPLIRWVLGVLAGALVAGLTPELALGTAAFTVGLTRWPIYRFLLRVSEAAASSWRETDLGLVRVLHIGWLAAVPAFASAAYAVVLLGPGAVAITVGLFVAITIGAALWAQLIEGSPALSRPYGFFGGVAGTVVYALLAPLLFGASPWLVLGGFAAAAPWAQGFGRLRCFANGCCHGAPCGASYGVVYRNPHTRVVRLAKLGGVPIHPTELYSFLGNVLIGVVTMRLWAEGASLALITGVYFSLMGLARFVEEAWRGEPQTPVYAGLRLYQWVAIGCLVVGAALTTVPGAPSAPAPIPSATALWAGLGAGALVWLVSSIDFPRSKRRFARLA